MESLPLTTIVRFLILLDHTSDNLKFLGVSNAIFDEETHYITVIYEVDVYVGKLKIMEPDKFDNNKLLSLLK